MSSNNFRFKKFTVCHDRCAMKVGTDGVLLGAWAETDNVLTALDIGTGTGLIAIMLAQRSKATIDGIEIEELAFQQALENVDHCPWKERIQVRHVSFQTYCKNENKKYDLIVSNPPYFSNSLKAPDSQRSVARHNDILPFKDLVQGITLLLADEGKFCLILPFESETFFLEIAKTYGLSCSKITRVISKPGKSPYRSLIELMKKTQVTQTSLLAVAENDGSYSREYKKLTAEFYLAF